VPAIPAAPGAGPILTKPVQDGTLNVSHRSSLADGEEVTREIRIDEQGNLKKAAEAVEATVAPPALPLPTLEAPKEESVSTEPVATAEKPAEPAETPPNASLKEEKPPGPHDFLDPRDQSSGTPFTANTQAEWKDPANSTPIDPLAAPENNNKMLEHRDNLIHPTTKTPGPVIDTQALPPPPAITESADESTPSVDSARNAVESALSSAPSAAINDPLEAIKDAPPEFNLPTQEPSLPLPSEEADTAPQKAAPQDKPDRPGPPPGPPPIIIDANALNGNSKNK
jgi:hypothetical protein